MGASAAVLVDNPQEVPIDINPGQRLRIREGVLCDATYLQQIPGEALDPDTKRLIEEQQVFLVVQEEAIEILSS